MSEILSNIVVQSTNLNFVPNVASINVTPEPIQLNVYTAGFGGTGNSANAQLLYNYQGFISGVANTQVSNGNLRFTNLSNLQINGGVNGYVLQTDGTGNLTWTAQTGGGGGNGSPGGANTQVQFNDGGSNFGGNAGFTFDKTSGNLNVPGNVLVTAQLSVSGNITGSNINATSFYGDGYNISNINSANINGTVATAITVTGNNQPNITSTGTLSNLSVSGNITVDTINTANINITDTTSLYQAIENVAIIGAQTGTYNFDMLDGSIQYSTANATANLILNFRGNASITANTMIGNGKSISSTYLMTSNATGYVISSITIDGNSQSIKWVNGSAPISTANVVTAYTFTIVKINTTPTYNVFGSFTRYA